MNERGFSLVEVIAAMAILTVGVLGLAASSRAITQMTGSGLRSGGAAAVAASRFDILRVTPCASLAGGTATSGKYAESWGVTVSGFMRIVTDSVTYAGQPRARTAAFSTVLSCAPIAS